MQEQSEEQGLVEAMGEVLQPPPRYALDVYFRAIAHGIVTFPKEFGAELHQPEYDVEWYTKQARWLMTYLETHPEVEMRDDHNMPHSLTPTCIKLINLNGCTTKKWINISD